MALTCVWGRSLQIPTQLTQASNPPLSNATGRFNRANEDQLDETIILTNQGLTETAQALYNSYADVEWEKC